MVAKNRITKTTVTTQRTAPLDGNNAPLTHVTSFSYGPISTFTTPDGAVAQQAYGLKKEQVEPGTGVGFEEDTAYAYDGYGNVTVTTTCASDFDHCTAGGTTSDVIQFRTTTVSYDPNDFNAPAGYGLVRSLNYPAGRFPVRTTNAALQSEFVAYDPESGALVQKTGVDGLHTCYSYDDLGREVGRTERCGSHAPLITTTARALATPSDPTLAKLVTIVRPPNGGTSWVYTDALGRAIATRGRSFGGGFSETTTSYNSAGQIHTKSTPHDLGGPVFATTNEYDSLLRPTSVSQDLGAIGTSGSANDVTTIHYLGVGNMTDHVVNGQHQQRYEEKNVFGKTSFVTNALGEPALTQSDHYKMWYAYDADGNLTDAGDPANATIPTVHTAYDVRGRRQMSRDPDLGTWTYEYDGFGDLIKQTDATNQTTSMTYDLLGRMTAKTNASAAGSTSYWVYDTGGGAGVGKLAAMVSGSDSTLNGNCAVPGGVPASGDGRAVKTYSYDQLGNLAAVNECADAATFTTTYEYDSAGRQRVIHYPAVGGSQLSVAYHYTSVGYLHYVTDESVDYAVLWVAKAMNALGQVTDEQMRNGVETTADRNLATGWTRTSTSTAHYDQNTVIQSWTNAYDEVGNLLTRDRADAVNDAPSTEIFQYDALNRVTSSEVKIPGLGPNGYDHIESYTYDLAGLGNLASKNGVQYTYGSGCTGPAGPHALCVVPGTGQYAYDGNGNMTDAGPARHVDYNWANKPLHITQEGASGTSDIKFAYGADGNRVIQVATVGGEVSRTLYVGLEETGKSLLERTCQSATGGGCASTQYTYFLYAGGTHGGNAFAVRVLDQSGNVTESRYFSFDHLGSTTAVSNDVGHVASVATAGSNAGVVGYDPWGARRNPDGQSADPSSFEPVPGAREFTGQEAVPGAGLVNMNGRVYDPAVGRFLTPDPTVQFIGDLQSYNRYSYALNNPLRDTDPTGYSLLTGWKGAVIGGAIGALTVVTCVGTGGAACVFVAWVGVVYGVTSTLASGASNSQAIAVGAISAFAGVLGGGLGSAVTAGLGGSLAAQVVGGALGGAISAAASSLALTGSVGWQNVVVGAAAGAASAAVAWAVRPAPVDQATALQAEGGGGSGEASLEASNKTNPAAQGSSDGKSLDVLFNKERTGLSPQFMKRMQPVFDDFNVDLSDVTVQIGGKSPCVHPGNPCTVGNHIYFPGFASDPRNYDWTASNLIHELGHVVQFTNAGLSAAAIQRVLRRQYEESQMALHMYHTEEGRYYQDPYVKDETLGDLAKNRLSIPYYTLDSQADRFRDVILSSRSRYGF